MTTNGDTSGLIDALIAAAPEMSGGPAVSLNGAESGGDTVPLPGFVGDAGGASNPETFDAPSDAGTVGAGRETFTDVAGTVYNPAIHEWDAANNRPRTTVAGKFRTKRGGGAKNAAQAEKQQERTENAGTVDYGRMAKFVTGNLFAVAESAIGPEWKPTAREQDQLEFYTEAYCRSMGFTDIPPGMALCVCLGMYAIPRINHPNTKAKLRNIAAKVGIIKKGSPNGEQGHNQAQD